MNDNQTNMEFEDYDTGDSFDALYGSSDQVISDAYIIDTGRAITETDLLTPGKYPLHMEDGVAIFAVIHDNFDRQIVVNVMPWIWTQYRLELRDMRDIASTETGRSISPIWHVPAFLSAILLAVHDVHPQIDELAFEKVLWREYPEAWIQPEKAPR